MSAGLQEGRGAPVVTALANRPCVALARPVEPLFVPWRGRLRELLIVFLARQQVRQHMRRLAHAYGLFYPGDLHGEVQ